MRRIFAMNTLVRSAAFRGPAVLPVSARFAGASNLGPGPTNAANAQDISANTGGSFGKDARRADGATYTSHGSSTGTNADHIPASEQEYKQHRRQEHQSGSMSPNQTRGMSQWSQESNPAGQSQHQHSSSQHQGQDATPTGQSQHHQQGSSSSQPWTQDANPAGQSKGNMSQSWTQGAQGANPAGASHQQQHSSKQPSRDKDHKNQVNRLDQEGGAQSHHRS